MTDNYYREWADSPGPYRNSRSLEKRPRRARWLGLLLGTAMALAVTCMAVPVRHPLYDDCGDDTPPDVVIPRPVPAPCDPDVSGWGWNWGGMWPVITNGWVDAAAEG